MFSPLDVKRYQKCICWPCRLCQSIKPVVLSEQQGPFLSFSQTLFIWIWHWKFSVSLFFLHQKSTFTHILMFFLVCSNLSYILATWISYSLNDPLQKLYVVTLPYFQDGCHGFSLVDKLKIFFRTTGWDPYASLILVCQFMFVNRQHWKYWYHG